MQADSSVTKKSFLSTNTSSIIDSSAYVASVASVCFSLYENLCLFLDDLNCLITLNFNPNALYGQSGTTIGARVKIFRYCVSSDCRVLPTMQRTQLIRALWNFLSRRNICFRCCSVLTTSTNPSFPLSTNENRNLPSITRQWISSAKKTGIEVGIDPLVANLHAARRKIDESRCRLRFKPLDVIRGNERCEFETFIQ